MEFEQVKSNFVVAARLGLEAQLHWIDGKIHPVSQLILDHLLPLAQVGLANAGISSKDMDRFLGIIRERVKSGQTGSAWIRKSFASAKSSSTLDVRLRTVTKKLVELQGTAKPVHEWPVEDLFPSDDYGTDYESVGQFMSTALFTVSPDDIVDYVASIMHWEHIRHLPVEDEEGRLVGLVSQRDLLVLLAQGSSMNRATSVPVSRIMKTDILAISPDTKTLDAMKLMKNHQVGCLPVVKNGKLIGILTTYDLLAIASKLLEKQLRSS